MMGTVVSGVVTHRDLVPRKRPKSGLTWSAPEGIRTPNLLIRSQMLYPLSYGRQSSIVGKARAVAAEARGFEPPVPRKGDNSLAVSPIRPLWHASSNLSRVPDHCRDPETAGSDGLSGHICWGP